MLETSVYHKILRISSVVTALVLLFQAGLVSDATARMALGTQTYMANSVGVFVGVEPTELNQLTAEITAQKLALDAREEALAEREIEVGLAGSATPSQQTTTYIISGVLFVLIVLMVLNYTLDFMRARDALVRQKLEQATVAN
jgi:hypothetical protein